MSGAERIKQRILDEARTQAQATIEQAKKEAAAIMLEASREAEQKRSDILQKAGKEAEDSKKRLVSVLELEGRKQRLTAKQQLIDEAFADALNRMNSLPLEQYSQVLAAMIADSVIDTDSEIILSQADKLRLSSGFEEMVNKLLKQRGTNRVVRISDITADINGGFILRSGDIEINNSFETVLKLKRDELEGDVVKILFS